MGTDPLISIVIPAWKPRADWLRAAVGSALAQRDALVEVVLVDDGSPEPVAAALADLGDERLRHIRVEHGGVAHARNAGAAASRGAFVRFADADDVLEPGSCARLLRLTGESKAIAYGATAVCDEELRPQSVKSSRLEGWIARECLLYRFQGYHVSMLFPRSVVEAVGGWETSMVQCSDWDYVLRAFECAPARGEQAIATFYRRHPASLATNIARGLDYESVVVDRYFERHPDEAGSSLEREARAKLLLVRARSHAATGINARERRRLVKEACALHPRRAAEELFADAVTAGKRRAARVATRLKR